MGAACANAKLASDVPKIKVINEVANVPSNSSRQTEPATTKISIFSKQVSNISSEEQATRKQLSHRSTLNSEEPIKILKQQQSNSNPGKEQLLKQREFILGKFLSDLQIIETTIRNDIVQMLRMFLSHLEQSAIYWCRVWLVNKNDYSIVVAYTNSVGEIRKIRILYTKQIEYTSNMLDNFHYYQQFNYMKFYDYSFRLNKRHQNYYIFSEQEYCDNCLEQTSFQIDDIYSLLEYLLQSVSLMHKDGYTHTGIKPSNLFSYLNQQCKKRYKLDISFQALKFNRRNQKTKDIRANQVNDLEDIAITIINLFYKGSDVRQQLKQKNTDFQAIVNQLYQNRKDQLQCFLKDIIVLLHRSKQYLYELNAFDYLAFLNSQSMPELPEIPYTSSTENDLFYYQEDLIQFFALTQSRSQKSLTKFQLIDSKGDVIKIIPNSAYLKSKVLYFAYQDMIGCIDVKYSNEQVEDTIEILQMALKQIMSKLENQRERVDSASPNYQLFINQHSPTQSIGDQFKFNNINSTNTNNNKISMHFLDRTFFSIANIAELYNQIKQEESKMSVDQLNDFLQKYSEFIDNSLLSMLLKERLEELFQFFCDKNMNLKEFEQIFHFKKKSHIPIYQRIVKQLKNAPNVLLFAIYNDSVYFYDGTYLYTDTEPIELDYKLCKLVVTDNSLLMIGRKNDCLYLSNLQGCNTQTIIEVPDQFGFQRLSNILYAILLKDQLVIYNVKLDKSYKLQIQGINEQSQIYIQDSLMLFIDNTKLYKIFISEQRYAVVNCNIQDTLQQQGRFDSKVKINIQQKQNSSYENWVGTYNIIKQLYPQEQQNICQFKLIQVIKDKNRYLLIQRIIHSEYESFDDSYQICKYLDKQLLDFFLSIEFDGRIRLNYVIENSETFMEKCDWTVLKRCIKTLYQLKSNSIYVQEMHPSNIVVYQERILFTTLMSKTNYPSLFSDKQVPIVGALEYMDPKSFNGAVQQLTYNQVFQNLNKSNIYSLGMIFLRSLSQYKIKNTKEQSLYLMEVSQALQQMNCSQHLQRVIEEMLKENEEQRYDSWGLLSLLHKIEEKNRMEIYFPQQVLSLDSLNKSDIANGYDGNTYYRYEQCLEQHNNIFTCQVEVVALILKDTILIKKGNYEYKLLFLKFCKKQSEIVDFQHYADIEEDDYNNQLILPTKCSIIAQPHEVIRELEVPIFELQNVTSCNCIMSQEDIYFFGYSTPNGKGSNDCFIYIQKRQLFKKIGTLLNYYKAQILDYQDKFYLFQTTTKNRNIKCQIINKQPFICLQQTINMKTNQNLSLHYFQHQQNVVAISIQPLLAWLINLETYKAISMKIEITSYPIESIEQVSQGVLLTQQGVLKVSVIDNCVRLS